MWIHKKRCTAETDGTVMNIQGKGSEGLTVITVEYEVKNQKYQIKESIKLKSTVIRIGFLPIGQRKKPRMQIHSFSGKALLFCIILRIQEAC